MKKILVLLLMVPGMALAAETGYRLDPSPHDPTDLTSLQRGAKLYVNYCLGCHSVQYVRYGGLTALGITEAQIREHLMFTGEKVGEPIRTGLTAQQGKQWFGVPPPDLSVISRVRGADWLYTYLRTFYRDAKTVTGWNNAVFPNVAMPHVLWQLQGERARQDGKWVALSEGTLSRPEYDAAVRDLVNFLVYVGEPSALSRERWGIVVLFVLAILFVLAWMLKREYWKDVK